MNRSETALAMLATVAIGLDFNLRRGESERSPRGINPPKSISRTERKKRSAKKKQAEASKRRNRK